MGQFVVASLRLIVVEDFRNFGLELLRIDPLVDEVSDEERFGLLGEQTPPLVLETSVLAGQPTLK